MHNSDRNTMMTKADREMNRPYLWAIHDVNAIRTGPRILLSIIMLDYLSSKNNKEIN